MVFGNIHKFRLKKIHNFCMNIYLYISQDKKICCKFSKEICFDFTQTIFCKEFESLRKNSKINSKIKETLLQIRKYFV